MGVEAFVAAAGGGGYVARYDLASGRELGALLAVPADDSGAEYSGLGYAAAGAKRLACVAAGGPGSGLVAAAGEGGDVHLWDSRVAPRGSRRGSTAAGAGSAALVSAGVAPVMTLRVPGASSVSSVSLAADGVTLATTAANGARVFDLRAPASGPARAPGEHGTRPEVGERVSRRRGDLHHQHRGRRLRVGAQGRGWVRRALSRGARAQGRRARRPSPERRRIDRRGGSRRGGLFVPQARVRVRARALPL